MTEFGETKVWKESITLPTYRIGCEDPNPIFLEKRVYQGSSGAVYPYGVIDTITGDCEDSTYQAVYLENDFIRILILPELGGRVHRAYDKVKKRDFIYHNEVVKPALVGLLGPWISGGLEFNWPQHHRPTTFMPVDVTFHYGDDGTKTVWVGEVEPMRGLQVMTGFKLYPQKALLEITGKIFNGNVTPRHFLWWANPAVKGGEHHQSVFPPDVTAVFDHGKRDISAFPIARGTYYKVDYSAGVDISRYKNIPVPTSYMAHKSEYDFVGSYHHGEQGGLLHVADHHVSPGKKQWTWGNCDFGLAWDRNLTDKNGPYIEIMTGVFTDNQPDFSWIAPFEEKAFVQNFLPYSELGTLQNANTEAAIKLERVDGELKLGVYAISPLENVTLLLRDANQDVYRHELNLAPAQAWLHSMADSTPQRLTLAILRNDGKEIICYQEHISTETPLPEAAVAPKKPEEITSTDELYFIGQHLDQYLHATRSPFEYYLRALELDPLDYRCNVALATLEYNRANFSVAKQYADNAMERATKWNSNPQCGQASMLRGAANEKLGHESDSYDDYFKATWSGNCRDAGFYALAQLSMRKGDMRGALNHVTQCLNCNGTNNLAMGLKALAMHFLGENPTNTSEYVESMLKSQPLSYVLHYVRYLINGDANALLSVTGDRGMNACVLAGWLMSLGRDADASSILKLINSQESMPLLYQACLDEPTACLEYVSKSRQNFGMKVRFPNTLDDVTVLQKLLGKLPANGWVQYLLGCFYYSKRSYTSAENCWESAVKQLPDFASLHRVLGIYNYNKKRDLVRAKECLLRAVQLEPANSRMLFEFDCFQKLVATPTAERLEFLEARKAVGLKRDDLTVELLSLYHIHHQLDAAAKILGGRQFHPWEGGEGKATGQYRINQQRRALSLIKEKRPAEAYDTLLQSLKNPGSLGEGRLVGQTDNDIWFMMSVCAPNKCLADTALENALHGGSSLSEGRYYNDQPVEYLFYQAVAALAVSDLAVSDLAVSDLAVSERQLKQSQKDQSIKQFESMINFANQHQSDVSESDFFAVSLPDLIALDSASQDLHVQHCLWVKALGTLGLGDRKEFAKITNQLLTQNPAHDKTHLLCYALECGVFDGIL